MAISTVPELKEGELRLDSDAQEEILKALLIGLQAYGEIERLDNQYDLLKIAGIPFPKEFSGLRPIHPTGSADTVGLFASALRWINNS